MVVERPGAVRLYIDTSKSMPADSLGAMLSALNRSFRSYQRNVGITRRADLGIAAVDDGSIDLLLDAIKGIESIWKARELLAGFATHLMEVTQILIGARGGTVSNPDRQVVETLARPVANDQARQINIVNNGTMILNIDRDTADDILQGLQERRGAPAYVEPPMARTTVTPRTAISDREARALEGTGLEGTALLVDGEWYARLVHGEGVLVPLRGRSELLKELQHRAPYRFRGAAVRGAQNQVVAIEVSEATRLGGR